MIISKILFLPLAPAADTFFRALSAQDIWWGRGTCIAGIAGIPLSDEVFVMYPSKNPYWFILRNLVITDVLGHQLTLPGGQIPQSGPEIIL